MRLIRSFLLVLTACGAPSNKPHAPAVAARSTTALTAIGTHDAFCGGSRDGCARSCLPIAWSNATPTFTHAQLWRYEDRCPDAAVQQVRCTLAVEHAGVWYEAVDRVCESDMDPAVTTSLEINRVISRTGIDAFEFTTTGTLLSASEGEDGNRVDTTVPTSSREIAVCGIGASHTPSCLAPIYIGGRSMGDSDAERSWALDDGGVVRLGAFPEGQEPETSDDDGSASTFRVDLR
ncbi:MAG TPA: hypothetical protein VGM90_31930 [Kofleriaceae bacterium]